MPVLQVIFGGVLLAFGRKIFWLFVALIGFALGLAIATRLFDVKPVWLAILIALALGVVGALLATFVQRLAIGVAGFVAGGLILLSLAGLIGIDQGILAWVAFIVGGVVGAILLSAAFDWGLIALSSLAGASLVVEGLRLGSSLAWLVWIGLCVVGIVLQAAWMRSEKH